MKHLALIAMASMATIQFAHAQQYTFGPEVQSTPSASITYDSQTGTFQYTDTANSSDDSAYLPLTGSAATFITASNDWTASVTVNLSGRSMTATGTDEWPHAFMVLGVLTSSSTHVIIELIQANNTEGGGSSDYPDGFYGTVARFAAKANGVGAVTTPLSNSLSSSGGGSYLQLSGQTGPPDSPSTESISAVSGVLTLSFNASTDILTGYYNGTPVGSYSLAGWGSNPPMTLVVSGGSGEGVGVQRARLRQVALPPPSRAITR